MPVVYQPYIHVVVHRNRSEMMVHLTLFGDGLPVAENRIHLAARCGHQANEEKQDCDDVSFHRLVGSICVVYGSQRQR